MASSNSNNPPNNGTGPNLSGSVPNGFGGPNLSGTTPPNGGSSSAATQSPRVAPTTAAPAVVNLAGSVPGPSSPSAGVSMPTSAPGSAASPPLNPLVTLSAVLKAPSAEQLSFLRSVNGVLSTDHDGCRLAVAGCYCDVHGLVAYTTANGFADLFPDLARSLIIACDLSGSDELAAFAGSVSGSADQLLVASSPYPAFMDPRARRVAALSALATEGYKEGASCGTVLVRHIPSVVEAAKLVASFIAAVQTDLTRDYAIYVVLS